MGVRDSQKNLSLRITVWDYSASLVMPDSNPRDGFFHLPIKSMIDSYNLLTAFILNFEQVWFSWPNDIYGMYTDIHE